MQKTTCIEFASLPTLGSDLNGGTFEGITTRQDGTHCAVVLLPGFGKNLTWEQAKKWAAKQGGELPTQPVAALLFANAKDKLKPKRHWTAYELDAAAAWICDFFDGYQYSNHKSLKGSAVAVRLIPITNKASK